MSTSKKTKRVCENGHTYYKTSTCPVCPTCEKGRKPIDSFLSLLSTPARRALEREGITTLKKLSTQSESSILALHGMGPSSIPKIKEVLALKGLSFKK